jgi:hypothetical protein
MKGLKLIGLLLFVLSFATIAFAQNETQRASVIRIEGSAGQFAGRTDVEMPPAGTQQMVVADGFSYYTTSGGIFLILPRPNNNVRLFALTGQLLWSGELVSGRFFIPTKSGIYFLRVNNKSYKVSCK